MSRLCQNFKLVGQKIHWLLMCCTSDLLRKKYLNISWTLFFWSKKRCGKCVMIVLFLFALLTRWQYFIDYNRCVVTENELLWNTSCVFINLPEKESYLCTPIKLKSSLFFKHCHCHSDGCTAASGAKKKKHLAEGSLACSFLHFIFLWLLQHEVVTVPGSHHVHLNNPENVAPIVSDFLRTRVLSQSAGAEEPMSKL